ncbi:Sec-independent protein translocase protein tatA/E-like protein, partial [uncultured Microcoleus sp.]
GVLRKGLVNLRMKLLRRIKRKRVSRKC